MDYKLRKAIKLVENAFAKGRITGCLFTIDKYIEVSENMDQADVALLISILVNKHDISNDQLINYIYNRENMDDLIAQNEINLNAN